ncbi:MAG: cytochrome c family protein [Rhodospirillales bacterium]|nr:cytochrome c family protein [Rhodospirillales bacterium]
MEPELVKNLVISFIIAVVLVVVVNVIGELTVRPRAELPPPQEQAVSQEAPAQQEEPQTPAAKAAPAGIASLLASYDPDAGTKAFRKCKACHTSEKDDKNRIGPNLWDIVGREKGGVEGFKYSDAMKLKGGTWTFEDLDHFLINPRTFVMGTKMSLKGIKDAGERATIIGFLRALSDNPKALP